MSPETIPYQLEGSDVKLEVIYRDENVWLNQAQMATLFSTNQSGIARHIKNIFDEGEVAQKGNMQKLHITGFDRASYYYSLEVI